MYEKEGSGKLKPTLGNVLHCTTDASHRVYPLVAHCRATALSVSEPHRLNHKPPEGESLRTGCM